MSASFTNLPSIFESFKRVLPIPLIKDCTSVMSAIIDLFYTTGNQCCKLSDLIIQTSERNNGKTNNAVLSVSNKNGFVLQNELFEDRIIASDDTSNYKIVQLNDFAYNPARINVGSIARLSEYNEGIVSPMYICFKRECKLNCVMLQ